MAETVKAVFDEPARYAGAQVLVRARVARALLYGAATASSVGTVSLALREPEVEFSGEPVLTREVPVLTAAAASRIAALASAATADRLVLMFLLQVDGHSVAIRDVFPP
jgi:hypothetical protein